MHLHSILTLVCLAIFSPVADAGRIKLFDKQPRAVHDFAGLDVEPNFRRVRGQEFCKRGTSFCCTPYTHGSTDGSADKKGTRCVFDSGEGFRSRFWNPKYDGEDGKGEKREECLGKGICCFSGHAGQCIGLEGLEGPVDFI